MCKRLFACVLLLAMSGCVIPLHSKSYPAPRFSKEELAFLDAPDATREETTATLGPPLLDIADPGVLVYTREQRSRALVVAPDKIGPIELTGPSGISESGPKIWTLFVAYDQHGRILAHEVRKLGAADLEKTSVRWRLAKAKSQ